MDLKTKKVTIIVVAILAVAFIFYVVSNALPSWYVTIVPTIFDLVHSVTTLTDIYFLSEQWIDQQKQQILSLGTKSLLKTLKQQLAYGKYVLFRWTYKSV